MPHDYDLLVLGAGSGGVALSRRAALHGAKVAVVESSRVGGTCVIRGCVPKKLLMYAAQFHDTFVEARGFGWDVPSTTFKMAQWAATKAKEIDRLEDIYRQMLLGGKVELVEGHATFEGPQRVLVGTRSISASHIVIATGASPVRDSIPGIEACATSDDLLDLTALPAAAAVIGGGYIAVEFASMLQRLGVAVSMFYRDTLPLRGFDTMLRQGAAVELQAAGIQLRPGAAPQHIERSAAGFLLWHGEDRALSFPWVLNATGRRPNTNRLNLNSVGVAVDAMGAVKVDAQLRSTSANIYAIGDVTNRKNLTPVAIAEGRALADALFNGAAYTLDLSLVASGVFMLPPIASIGPSEADLVAAGTRVKVFETDFRPMKQAFIAGPSRTHMKLLVDDHSDVVLAVHMMGTDAPEIVQSLGVALTAGATKAHFDHTIAMHPTAAEEFVLLRQPVRVV
jgi:glutathione reductase (NADPH)